MLSSDAQIVILKAPKQTQKQKTKFNPNQDAFCILFQHFEFLNFCFDS